MPDWDGTALETTQRTVIVTCRGIAASSPAGSKSLPQPKTCSPGVAIVAPPPKRLPQPRMFSEGTLYNYFANKRDLFIGLMRSRTDDLIGAIAEVRSDSVEGAYWSSCSPASHPHAHTAPVPPPGGGERGGAPGSTRPWSKTCCRGSAARSRGLWRGLIDAGVMRRVYLDIAQLDPHGRGRWVGALRRPGRCPCVSRLLPAEELAAQVSDVFINGLRGTD